MRFEPLKRRSNIKLGMSQFRGSKEFLVLLSFPDEPKVCGRGELKNLDSLQQCASTGMPT